MVSTLIKLFITLFVALLSAEANEVPKRGVCLLTKKKRVGKISVEDVQDDVDHTVSLLSTQHKAQSESRRAFRERHQIRMQIVNDTQDEMDKFIAASKGSSDACSARLLHAKHILDELMRDVKSTASKIDSHEEVLETENENLNITMMSVKSVTDSHAEAVEKCKALQEEAKADMKQYTSELEELKQIANPEVRYASGTNVPSPKSKVGLLQDGAWSNEQCMAFLNFLTRSNKRRVADVGDCDKQREKLQKEFTKAYKDIADLLTDATNRGNDDSCFKDAEAEKIAAMVPLVSQREQATTRIESANHQIASLNPLLDQLKGRVAKLQKHIDEHLRPECKEAGDCSKALALVRKIIHELSQCPECHPESLKLEIPHVQEEAQGETEENEAVAPAAKADAP